MLYANMGRVQSCFCLALFLLCGLLLIGAKTLSGYSGTRIHQAKAQIKWQYLATRQLAAENSHLQCLRAVKSSIAVDSKGYLNKQWYLYEGVSEESICNLASVECSPSTGPLTRLDLANVGLSGGFPMGLFKCSSLTSISLSYNNFTGPLPPDLCLQLPFLVELDFSWNFFTENVEFLNCSFLVKLHLHGNQFSGGIGFSDCVNLTSLTLSHNNFTGKLPQDLCTKLPLLADVDLSHNQFSDGFEFSNCASLIKLDLSYNDLSGEIPATLSDCLLLRTLSLQHNLLSGSIPQGLGLLPNLTSLDLSYNALFGPIPSSIFNNPRLSYLDLKSNARLCGPAKLMSEDMYDDWECLRAFKSSVLDIDNRVASWNLSCMFPGNICSFAGVECWSSGQVAGLKLDRSGLTGTFSLGLSKCKGLETLSLTQNRFTGRLPADLCNWMPSLRDLDLSYNKFTGDIPTELSNCKNLTTLRLQNNLLSGRIPSALGTLPSLITLDISSNSLSGSIHSSLLKPSLSVDSFAKNPHLCGPPLASHCASKQSPLLILGISGGALLALFFLALVLILFFRARKQVCKSSSKSPAFWPKMFDAQLRVTWIDLQQATSGFSQANLIGRGGSGEVYKGKLLNGQSVAIKVLKGVHELDQEMGLNAPKQFLTEIDVMGKLRHRNLLRVLGYCYSADTMAIILDFMPLGSLNALLHNDAACQGSQQSRPKLGLKVHLGILVDIAEGLVYLHHEYDGHRCVIHGDLKPGNVLLDEHMKACIADFGLARMVQNINTGSIAKPSRQVVPAEIWCSNGYTAPEATLQGIVSRKADIYSFGVIVLEVITGERPSSYRLEEGQTLVDWVGKALEKGEPHSVVLLLLESEWKQSSDDITALLRLGCTCASLVPTARPAMHQVVTLLRELVVKHTLRQHSSTYVHLVDHS